MFRFVWIVCAKDLLQRLRDRTGLLVAVVVPLALSGLVGLALGSNDAAITLRLALVDLDKTEDADALRTFLVRDWRADIVILQETASVDEALELLEDDDTDVGLVLQPGFRADPGTEDAPTMEVLSSGHNPFGTRMVVSLAERFLAEPAAEDLAEASRGASGAQGQLAEMNQLSPGGQLRPVDYYALSMTVLFLTFTVLSGVRSLQEEVEAGVMARLVASPATPNAILGGKLLGLMLLGILQVCVMVFATSTLFGTTWGDPLPVAGLVFTSVLMAIGMTSFFMAVARNADQGQLLASISIFILAVIGGQFLPPQGLPEIFDTLQRLTPNGQAARGFMDIAAAGPGAGLGTALEPMAYTLAVGVGGIAFAARRMTRGLERHA